MNHPAIRKGGVASVTGAAAGIGFAIARRLVKEGMKVVLFDRDSHSLLKAVQSIQLEFPDSELLAVDGDVTSDHDLKNLYQQSTNLGEVSLLVNNAAIIKGAGPWNDDQQWRRVMATNFWSILTLQQLFVDQLLVQNSPAAIVNVGSKEGITTPPGNAAYAVSKASVRVLTEQLAHELRERTGQRVTAHLLIPGYTFTPMNFPGADPATAKPAAAWSANQVADRMIEAMSRGDFYLFCEDNEVTRELDQFRLQWSADDLIKNRPALSRWHPAYRLDFDSGVAHIQEKESGR